MKIGFVSEHYPPTDGGVATSAQRVARALVRQGVEVHVICFDHSRDVASADYCIEELDQGVQVSRIGPFFLKQPALSADQVPEKVKATLRRRAFEAMSQILRRQGVDVILAFYLLNAGFLAQYVARHLRVPFVAGIRGNDLGRNMFHVERFGVISWIVQGADTVVCVNDHLRERLLLAHPNVANKTLVIPNSVRGGSTHSRAQSRAALARATGWDESALRIVFIGTLREKKGVAPLVEALGALGPDSPVRFLVVGPDLGSMELRLCGTAWQTLKDRGHAFVSGMVPRDDVASWAAGCDVVVMPSLDDGMANGLLEGMAMGLCPVASHFFSDVITDNVNGLLVPAGDSDSLAAALQRLNRNREAVHRMGQAAAEKMLQRTPDDEARDYAGVFARVQAQGKDHP
ncbi:MAG: glycosyltransferase family 4 protein [bacterium]